MKCCICGQDLTGKHATVDDETGEAFCQRDRKYLGMDPSKRPNPASMQSSGKEENLSSFGSSKVGSPSKNRPILAPQPALSDNAKIVVHMFSLFLLPMIIYTTLITESFNWNMLLVFALIFGYLTFLYYLVGGFEWDLKKIPLARRILFLVLGLLLYSLILYALWQMIRWIAAKLRKLPYSNIKLKLFPENLLQHK